MKSVKGFTIVELLVVIVVIAILASISIVAYTGIQNRARDASRNTAVASLQRALELYRTQEGVYPDACNGVGGCSALNLSSFLVPNYISSLPTDPESSKPFQYVRTANSDGYGLRVDFHSGMCKYRIGANTNSGWWGSGVPTCS